MSPTLADLVSYESDPESAPPSPRSRPQPLMTAPRFVANSPGPDYPPLGGGDLHPARLSLFPRIQMISDASDTRDTASTEASSSSARPRCSHSVDSSILGCYSAAHPQSASTTPVTSIPSIHQPSPRVARVEKMRALRPERKIRLWRTETSTVMSAASSDSSRTSSPMTRKPSCERSASPPALSSSASSECTVTSSQRRTRDADEAPPFINSSPSFHYVPKVQSQGAGTSVHPRFRRYVSPQRYTSLDMRDPHADDGGKGARNSREYSSGLARAPEEFSQSRHCDWSSSSSSSSHSCWAPHPDASSSERYHSPLSEPSTSPPRTPPLPVRARYVEATISMSPLGSDGEDELADDDDDDCARSSPASSPSAQPFPAQPLSTEASHASPSPMYARCCWQGCGELFQRNFGPLRKSYAPFNQMHHDVMDHYRTAHGLDFSSARKIPCRWDGCTKEMTGKSFSRHLLDAHMHLEAHRCERCFISFSRRDAVTRHMRKCTGKYAGRMVQPGGRPRVDKLGSPWAQPAAARVDPTNYAPRHLTTIPANVKSRSASEEPLAQVVKRELQNKPLSVHTC